MRIEGLEAAAENIGLGGAEAAGESLQPLAVGRIEIYLHRLSHPGGLPRFMRSFHDFMIANCPGARKAKRVADPVAARAVVEKVAAAEAAFPALIAVSITLDENPEVCEEDRAATMMGVQNLLLAASAIGLGTHLKRSNGRPPRPRGGGCSRRPASALTIWVP
ncbi:MAG TPA: hypothetical protein VFL95_12785 [Gemmatimonadales bacterium]|nr:hypothetical protein [Gemmatimonadales bacterium]